MPQKAKPIDKNQRLLGDSVLEIIADRYGFSTYDVVPFVDIGGEIVALDRRSRTASKAILKIRETQEKYLVKRFPWYMSRQSLVEFVATFQSNVARQYENVPDVAANTDDEIVTAIGNDYYFVQEFVSGSQKYDKDAPTSEEMCRNAGRALGELHATAEEAVPASEEHRETVFDLCRGILDILEEEVVVGSKERLSDTERRDVTEFIDYTSNRLNELEAEVGTPEEVLPVHGDYNPTNLVFEDDEVRGIVDFDNCCVGRPEHDVAEAIVTFSYVNYSRNSSRFGEPDDSWNGDNARAFLSGYTSQRDVNLSVLPSIGESIVLELFTLGVNRNDLPLSLAPELIPQAKTVRDRFEALVDTVE